MSSMIDIRHVLPAIRVPTLVLHRADEVLAEASRYVGERIPRAKVVELPGDNHMPWLGDEEAALDEIEEFLTGSRPHPRSIASSRRSCSPTSWAPPSSRPTSATAAGATCSSSTTPSSVGSSSVSAGSSSSDRVKDGEWYMSNCSRFAPQLSLKNRRREGGRSG
jgi:hypothetical protein